MTWSAGLRVAGREHEVRRRRLARGDGHVRRVRVGVRGRILVLDVEPHGLVPGVGSSCRVGVGPEQCRSVTETKIPRVAEGAFSGSVEPVLQSVTVLPTPTGFGLTVSLARGGWFTTRRGDARPGSRRRGRLVARLTPRWWYVRGRAVHVGDLVASAGRLLCGTPSPKSQCTDDGVAVRIRRTGAVKVTGTPALRGWVTGPPGRSASNG